ncbi:hypothetical protein MKX03_010588 [Papaver bracteatum]|nr:hypothetical protein MKX03_010588 [Papaver bracteatum]
MTSSSPSSNLRWTPTASPSSSPVPPPLLSKEKSRCACHDQIEDEPFMSPAHHQQQQQQLDQYVDEPVQNDIVKSKGSVVLTWEYLCVRVPSSSSKGNDKAIIEGINGYAQPGEGLAIMGPFGSGKSTLIGALEGTIETL